MPLVSLAVLACLGYVAFRLYTAPFMRQQWLYAVGALVVYWFSVSGARVRVRVFGYGQVLMVRAGGGCGCDGTPARALAWLTGDAGWRLPALLPSFPPGPTPPRLPCPLPPLCLPHACRRHVQHHPRRAAGGLRPAQTPEHALHGRPGWVGRMGGWVQQSGGTERLVALLPAGKCARQVCTSPSRCLHAGASPAFNLAICPASSPPSPPPVCLPACRPAGCGGLHHGQPVHHCGPGCRRPGAGGSPHQGPIHPAGRLLRNPAPLIHGLQVRSSLGGGGRAGAGEPNLRLLPLSCLAAGGGATPPSHARVQQCMPRRLRLPPPACRLVTSNHVWKTGMTTDWYLF